MRGYLVKSVAKGSPGEDAGLRGGTRVATIDGQQMVLGGDIILSVEGVPATNAANMAKVRDHLATMKPGQEIKAVILRAGRVIELTGKAP
jgi:serine protease Do